MGVKVRVKRGRYYLDIYQNRTRRWESLHMTRTGNAALDKEKDRLAEICRAKREMQLVSGEYKVVDGVGARIPLYDYIEALADTKNARQNYISALHWLERFPGGREIRLNQVDEAWLMAWQRYLLKSDLARATKQHYEAVVHTALNQAVRERRIQESPAKGVRAISRGVRIHDVLTEDDLQKLIDTPVGGRLGSEIKRAFLFACWTGLRISDVRTLEWKNIDQDKIRLVMHKTEYVVEVPLHPMAKAQLVANNDRLVFPLVGRTKTNSITYFVRWAESAGVQKKIGWHTARRTFATLAVEAGVDQYVISKLLGHTP